MAESQIPYEYSSTKDNLIASLSTERFRTFLKLAGGNQEYAFKLYLYNARLSKSALFPLHILEITLRNRVNNILIAIYGEDWPNDIGLKDILSTESLKSLNKGINRAKTSSTADVVSELTFDFWSNLFRPEYDRPLWQTHIQYLLPNENWARKHFQSLVKAINKFRNRIAHHEPIIGMDISKIHSDILTILKACCIPTTDWVKHHSTVNQILRTKPTPTGQNKPLLKERLDSQFILVGKSNSLSDLTTVSKKKFIVCTGDDGFHSIISYADIGLYFTSLIDKEGNLVCEMAEHTFESVINALNLESNFMVFGSEESLSTASQSFNNVLIKYLLVIGPDQEILGVIAKAHRRY
jgi:hypothetical protein